MNRNQILSAIPILLAIILGCTSSQISAPPEQLQGNCVGRILSHDEAPVKGVALFLIPEHYSPQPIANNTTSIDSTVSDE
jgi:hypothetical protein